MGKKRIITTKGDSPEEKKATSEVKAKVKRQILKGAFHITSSYNNTIVSVTDVSGNVFAWATAGSLGFKGARKSTPYAATLVAKEVAERAKRFGLQDAKIVVRGVGPGREAAIRGVVGAGIGVISIIDDTPQPHNGVRPPKPRRV